MRDVLGRHITRLEATINGVQPTASVPGDCRSALAARLEQLHERMAAAGALHEATSPDDVRSALWARLKVIALSAGQSRRGGDAGAG